MLTPLGLQRFKLDLIHFVEEEVVAEHLLLNRYDNVRLNVVVCYQIP